MTRFSILLRLLRKSKSYIGLIIENILKRKPKIFNRVGNTKNIYIMLNQALMSQLEAIQANVSIDGSLSAFV